jgi:two-component sensor histidine kinase
MGLSLALAVVVSSDAPLLLLDGDLIVLAASTSFCRSFGIEPSGVSGRSLFELGDGEWNVPQLRASLSATAAGFAEVQAYEMDLVRQGRDTRRLVLGARKLDYVDATGVRLLLSVSDVTEALLAAKLKDDLVREKDVLLREVQHRVAKSLQIISSVLLQSARKVQSDETRGYLEDAHNRVMSIAAVQRHLAASSAAEVTLRSYFMQLCNSLGASMIGDPRQIKLEVDVDDSAVDADSSISLGLIVTELVINALKHAFPADRKGKIEVKYRGGLADWTLSVSDDGVGMPRAGAIAKAGLGTSIVEALARQLRAHIHIADAAPGTTVSVVYATHGVTALSAARAI